MNEIIEKHAVDLTHSEKVTFLVQVLRDEPQVDCPVTHRFAPGVYLREIFMPAGTVVIGKIHKTEHFNIVERGVYSIVHGNGEREMIRAPITFVSKAGVQKVLYIHEDTIWKTVHVTEETDLEKLETILIEPPPVVRLIEDLEKLT